MAAHLASQWSLPIFELTTRESVYLEAQPPITCSATVGGERVGWVLVVSVSDADFKLASEFFDEALRVGMEGIFYSQGWRGHEFDRHSAVMTTLTTMMQMKEWARVFCASELRGGLQELFRLCQRCARGIWMAGDSQPNGLQGVAAWFWEQLEVLRRKGDAFPRLPELRLQPSKHRMRQGVRAEPQENDLVQEVPDHRVL